MPDCIAFCSDIPSYRQNGILEPEVIARHPGSAWVRELALRLREQGRELVSGDVALADVASGARRPSEIFVISEEESGQAAQLVSQGAQPLAIFCFESPLYARTFYENAARLCAPYPLKLVFSGLEHSALQGMEGVHAITIPNLTAERIMDKPIPWEERRVLTMVAGNKYWRSAFEGRFLKEPKLLESWARGKWGLSSSAVKREAVSRQLLDERLRLVEYFAQRGHLTLYGNGWLDRTRLPKRWQHIYPLIESLNPGPCEDKLSVLSGSRFTLCLENVRYPGYFTEKLLDCFAAGTIPLYLGDPEVATRVPVDAFIDLSHYANLDELETFMLNMDAKEAALRIRAGQDFLSSSAAKPYTYAGFAENVLAWAAPHLSHE